jgi:hypothetical protein
LNVEVESDEAHEGLDYEEHPEVGLEPNQSLRILNPNCRPSDLVSTTSSTLQSPLSIEQDRRTFHGFSASDMAGSNSSTLVPPGTESPLSMRDRRSFLQSLSDIYSSTTEGSAYSSNHLHGRQPFLRAAGGSQPLQESVSSITNQDHRRIDRDAFRIPRPPVPINVVEYNGMRPVNRLVTDLDQYLHHRSRGWTGIFTTGNAIKIVRFNQIAEHVLNLDERSQ